ncbi:MULTISPECIES: hypothetical protein [unclassified Microcoleus]|nr:MULTISPECIES: hypothetical protein [unclassified Microcoleus]
MKQKNQEVILGITVALAGVRMSSNVRSGKQAFTAAFAPILIFNS